MTDPYLHNREFFGAVSGNYRVAATDTGLIALVASIPAHTLFIQRLHIEVTTITGAELWTFQDGAGIPLVPSVSAAAIAHFDFDFGPDGVPCTEATALVLSISGATGAIGWITWEGFKKLTFGTAASVGPGGAPGSLASPTIIVSKPGQAAVPTDGLLLTNPTLSTAAVPVQMAPQISFGYHAWNTTPTATDTPITTRMLVLPVSGGTPNSFFQIWTDVPGVPHNGGFADLSLFSNGNTSSLVINGGVSAKGSFDAALNSPIFWVASTRLDSATDGKMQISTNGSLSGVGLDVLTDGTLKIRNRAQTADGQLAAASVRGNAVTVANLPAAPVEGMLCAVTDATLNTWGSVVAGGGANHVLAYYNGTAWTIAGK
jgi:hypothetical protein